MSRKTRLGRRALDGVQRLVGILRRPGSMSFIGQDARDDLPNVHFVVDNENIARHGRSSRFVDRRFGGVFGKYRIGRSGLAIGEMQADACAPPVRRIEQIEPPAVVFEDFGHDRQTEARALRTCRSCKAPAGAGDPLSEKPLPLSMMSRTTWSPTDSSTRMRPFGPSSRAAIPSAAFLMMLVRRLREQPAIEAHGDGRRRQAVLERDLGMRDAHQEHRAAHAFGEVVAFEERLRHARERGKNSSHHPLDVIDLPDDRLGALVEHLAVGGDQLAVFALDPLGGELDRCQRVLDLVRDPPGDVPPRRPNAARQARR